MTIFVGGLLLLLWLLQIVFLDDFYKRIKINEIQSAGNRIAKYIDNNQIGTLMENIAQDKEFCIVLATEEGEVIYSEQVLSNCTIHHMSYKDYYSFAEKARRNGGTDLQRIPYMVVTSNGGMENNLLKRAPMRLSKKMESVIYTQLIPRENGSHYVLMINGFISPVNATVETIRKQLIYVTFIMLTMAFVLALFIAKKVAQPIEKINNTAKKLATGIGDIHFEGKGYKEIAELSSTLTYAATELAKAENLRQELIANVSHDLRTPLTLITGYAEVMRDLPGENTPENTQIIIDEAKRLTNLVNDMLDLSKLQAGTVQLSEITFNLTESTRRIMSRYAALTEQEGYHITFAYDEEVNVKADELRLSQVLYNLINNAINYTGDDKKVIVRQVVHDGKVRIEVIDTGEGIEEESLPYIWDRYYKVDKTHKRATVGTGLGLSIVRTILESHGAEYGVISSNGVGSTFWFTLPQA